MNSLKKSQTIIYLLALSGLMINSLQKDVKAYPNTISACDGSIPAGNNTCLVDPTSYELDIYRVYICRSDPFPAGTNQADLTTCIALFKNDTTPYVGQLANNSFTLPSTGRESIVSGTYTHTALVLGTTFTGAGKYTSNPGATDWRTKGNFDGGTNVTTTFGDPVKSGETLSNWRGPGGNSANPYCKDGATTTRCEADFNNYQVTGIITDTSLTANTAPAERLFYLAQLTNPFTLTDSSAGSIQITVDNAYEVSGNNDGTVVEAMTIAPFVFQPNFVSN